MPDPISDISKLRSTIGQIGLMSANHIAATNGGYEPQRDYNFTFEVELGNIGNSDILILSTLQAPVPEWTADNIEIRYMNETRGVGGRPKMNPGVYSLYDYVDRAVARTIYEKWAIKYYNPATGEIGLASEYKKKCTLSQYAPNGTLTRQWEMFGVYPLSYKWGDANMDGNAACKIEMQLWYDKAIPTFNLLTSLNTITQSNT